MITENGRLSGAVEYRHYEQKESDPLRRIKGARSRASGKYFEALISAACAYYEQAGFAVIEKTPEPFEVTKRLSGGRFQGHFAHRAQPDYKGALRGGRCVVFEAKHTDAFSIKSDRVTAAQRTALEAYINQGAVCFVLISLGLERCYRVPWMVWRDMKTIFGRLYADETDLEPYRVPRTGGVILFLSGLEADKDAGRS